jgi:thioredoxin-like negative regulator of GroEL
MTPVLNKLDAAYAGKVVILGVDVGKNAELAKRLKVGDGPALILFKDGKPVETVAGVKKEDELKAILDKHLGAGKAGGDSK